MIQGARIGVKGNEKERERKEGASGERIAQNERENCLFLVLFLSSSQFNLQWNQFWQHCSRCPPFAILSFTRPATRDSGERKKGNFRSLGKTSYYPQISLVLHAHYHMSEKCASAVQISTSCRIIQERKKFRSSDRWDIFQMSCEYAGENPTSFCYEGRSNGKKKEKAANVSKSRSQDDLFLARLCHRSTFPFGLNVILFRFLFFFFCWVNQWIGDELFIFACLFTTYRKAATETGASQGCRYTYFFCEHILA